jgi:hypothetical protein
MTPSPRIDGYRDDLIREHAWTGQHKGETNGEICTGAWRIFRCMDLVATNGQSKGGWPFSGGLRPADGQHRRFDYT